MKKVLKAIIIAGAVFRSYSSSFAQVTGSYYISLKMEAPITIVNNVKIEFFNSGIVASGSVHPKHGKRGSSQTTGPVPPPKTPEALMISAAILNISGHPDYTYAIMLPASCTIINGNYEIKEVVLTSSPIFTGKLDERGMQMLTVKATLITSPIMPGIYSNSTSIPVTINYN